jgi:hypothetical protein
LRWLAILNSDIAIFGTPVSVQQELDRQIANSRPDSSRRFDIFHFWVVSGKSFDLLKATDPATCASSRPGGFWKAWFGENYIQNWHT